MKQSDEVDLINSMNKNFLLFFRITNTLQFFEEVSNENHRALFVV